MKKFYVLVWLLMSAWLMQAQHELILTVSDRESNAIPGAEIRLPDLKMRASADQNGKAVFPQVPTGSYLLKVSAIGFEGYQQIIEVVADRAPLALSLQAIRITEEVLITATRATEKSAITYSEIKKAEIEAQNFGQDLPFLLNQMTATVVTSDAGAGIGYTGIRIRGSDPTRTNVTINGIPLNDAESHGVFWVNLPDFASSIDNIQVQRGVGTSTNGAAAFGASINIQTNRLRPEAYAQYDNSFGSFNTWKHTLQAGTGLINNRFTVDARLSRITTDGWVDRAFSDLESFYVSAAYYGKKSSLRFNILSGREQTYQSWFGVPESALDNEAERRANFYTYDNETDNYWQDHYQLMYAYSPSERFKFNASLHYTQGRGYFEQFRAGDPFSIYALPNLFIGGDTVSSGDFIRRRWLDNDYYGGVYSIKYTPSSQFELLAGGGIHRYDGDHFGEIIWAEFAGASAIRDRYYESRGLKDDMQQFVKAFYTPNEKLSLFVDLQVRYIDYQIGNDELNGPGTDNDQQQIEGRHTFTFFNPKAGVTYQVSPNAQLYASLSIGNREPVRSDFIDAPAGRTPKHETLRNWELGYRQKGQNASFTTTLYLMDYENQLVLNGELNDVGANVRQNVPDSYRAGIELQGAFRLFPTLSLSANLSYSINKIGAFEELIYDYDAGGIITNEFEDTDISFSPNWVGGTTLSYRPINGLDIRLLNKYVGAQFLDNTGNEDRKLDAFFVQDLRLKYRFNILGKSQIEVGLLVNNLLDIKYEPNGYTFSYIAGGSFITENFFYPQAGTNYLASLSVKL